jgi:hypothetical protein
MDTDKRPPGGLGPHRRFRSGNVAPRQEKTNGCQQDEHERGRRDADGREQPNRAPLLGKGNVDALVRIDAQLGIPQIKQNVKDLALAMRAIFHVLDQRRRKRRFHARAQAIDISCQLFGGRMSVWGESVRRMRIALILAHAHSPQ